MDHLLNGELLLLLAIEMNNSLSIHSYLIRFLQMQIFLYKVKKNIELSDRLKIPPLFLFYLFYI